MDLSCSSSVWKNRVGQACWRFFQGCKYLTGEYQQPWHRQLIFKTALSKALSVTWWFYILILNDRTIGLASIPETTIKQLHGPTIHSCDYTEGKGKYWETNRTTTGKDQPQETCVNGDGRRKQLEVPAQSLVISFLGFLWGTSCEYNERRSLTVDKGARV